MNSPSSHLFAAHVLRSPSCVAAGYAWSDDGPVPTEDELFARAQARPLSATSLCLLLCTLSCCMYAARSYGMRLVVRTTAGGRSTRTVAHRRSRLLPSGAHSTLACLPSCLRESAIPRTPRTLLQKVLPAELFSPKPTTATGTIDEVLRGVPDAVPQAELAAANICWWKPGLLPSRPASIPLAPLRVGQSNAPEAEIVGPASSDEAQVPCLPHGVWPILP